MGAEKQMNVLDDLSVVNCLKVKILLYLIALNEIDSMKGKKTLI